MKPVNKKDKEDEEVEYSQLVRNPNFDLRPIEKEWSDRYRLKFKEYEFQAYVDTLFQNSDINKKEEYKN